MNISYAPVHITDPPQAFKQLSDEFPRALLYLLLPTKLAYFSFYFKIKGYNRVYTYLAFSSLIALWMCPLITPIRCGPARSLQYFAVSIGTMKILDMWARRNSPLTYTAGRVPADWLLPLILITELRYESFTPNHIRLPKNHDNFSEPIQLGIHVLAFAVLQSLPQVIPTVLAFEVLLAIYIIWTSIQLMVRYKTSPPLFGPLYLADSLTGFWSETWHNAFASPCASLAYGPIRHSLPAYGVPIPVARSLGIVGAFSLMAIFHVYSLSPIMDATGLRRIGIFFFLNGIATVAEGMVWGSRRHWLKTALAWAFEVALASWTAEAAKLPHGLNRIPWRELCDTS